VIRLATRKDRQQVFAWRNLPEVYELGTSKRKVTLAEHKRFFREVLKQEDSLLFIIEPHAGTVRLDRIDDFARISIYLLPDSRGKGLGLAAINAATREAFAKWPISKVIACVRADNDRSIQAFKRAGYTYKPSRLEGHVEMESL
jgi:RimJ/RimL family protein N-acetyltransferase